MSRSPTTWRNGKLLAADRLPPLLRLRWPREVSALRAEMHSVVSMARTEDDVTFTLEAARKALANVEG